MSIAHRREKQAPGPRTTSSSSARLATAQAPEPLGNEDNRGAQTMLKPYTLKWLHGIDIKQEEYDDLDNARKMRQYLIDQCYYAWIEIE